MDRVNEVVMKAAGELADSKFFIIQHVRNVDGFEVYYLNPTRAGRYGFPLMVIEKDGKAKLVNAENAEGRHFWKSIVDFIQ